MVCSDCCDGSDEYDGNVTCWESCSACDKAKVGLVKDKSRTEEAGKFLKGFGPTAERFALNLSFNDANGMRVIDFIFHLRETYMDIC
ncbi:hypothetical protein IGI04_005502 [Brassica rapa subsp. trilocularis]|uniref:Uncharacterized protein n=1 Tax=Brassica rapa subsp. trilocularis TaxID=1813537 RepID=A0ABQ7NER1_BRACM|nr:hypothetical protein IGI04_005502 [Brassica rapa subsp. trilocularis]